MVHDLCDAWEMHTVYVWLCITCNMLGQPVDPASLELLRTTRPKPQAAAVQPEYTHKMNNSVQFIHGNEKRRPAFITPFTVRKGMAHGACGWLVQGRERDITLQAVACSFVFVFCPRLNRAINNCHIDTVHHVGHMGIHLLSRSRA